VTCGHNIGLTHYHWIQYYLLSTFWIEVLSNIISPGNEGTVLKTEFCVTLCEHDGGIDGGGLCNDLWHPHAPHLQALATINLTIMIFYTSTTIIANYTMKTSMTSVAITKQRVFILRVKRQTTIPIAACEALAL
jgi:hypothetical protein